MTPKTNSPPLETIERVDDGAFRGWRVRFRENDVERVYLFDDERLGGASAALTAAARFEERRQTGAAAPLPRKSGTGIPGIRVGQVRTTAGRLVKNYTATWYEANGARVTRIFSWLKHGKERALRLAIEAREGGRAEAERSRRSRKAPAKPLLRHAKPTRHENVRRIDHNYFHGFVVSLRRAYARHAKYFNDQPDGRAKALESAISYRDSLRAALPAPVLIHRRSSVSTTGIIGVVHSIERTRSGGRSERFSAIWFTADGRPKKKSFSVAKYGFERAKELATRAREEGVERLFRDRKIMILQEIEILQEIRKRRRTPTPERPAE